MAIPARALVDGIGFALDSMRTQKLRSALTVLGVVIGVGTVMLMASLVDGVKASILATVENSSPRTFYVMRFFSATPLNPNNLPAEIRARPILSRRDVDAIRRDPRIDKAGLWIELLPRPMSWQGVRTQGLVFYGADDSYLDVMGGTLLRGRLFSRAELADGEPVVVIENDVADLLFGSIDPLGQTVRVASRPFRVVGIYRKPANIFQVPGAEFGGFMPFRAADSRFEYDHTQSLFIAVLGQRGVPFDVAEDAATMALRTSRGLKPGDPNSFDLITQDQILGLINSLTSAFFLVMVALSSVALMVGGIGVMAIMMVSVTDRTREIGVRKAVGATRSIIRWQFLVEAATLTLLGGVLGLLVGLGAGALLKMVLGLAAGPPIWSAVVAIAVSVGIGLVFGMIPALRASRLDPIEALRHE